MIAIVKDLKSQVQQQSTLYRQRARKEIERVYRPVNLANGNRIIIGGIRELLSAKDETREGGGLLRTKWGGACGDWRGMLGEY